MTSIREKVLREVERVKARDEKWYVWFNNFSLCTVPAREASGAGELYRERPDLLDKPFNGKKTMGEFLADVDRAFRETGKYDLMVERCDAKLLVDSSSDTESIREEALLAETLIEPYILLREMGYTHLELTT